MKTIQTIQTVFQVVLFVLSFILLILSFYKLLTIDYPYWNVCVILVFITPIFFAFILSGYLLIKNK